MREAAFQDAVKNLEEPYEEPLYKKLQNLWDLCVVEGVLRLSKRILRLYRTYYQMFKEVKEGKGIRVLGG